MGKSNEIFYCFVSLCVLNCYFVFCETSVKDEINTLTWNLKDSLISLGRNASQPQPKFGLDAPIDPLLAVAPLRYLHEGDLLKLRLQLNNVTLEGLSTLAVQEVSFNLPRDLSSEKSISSGESSSPSQEADGNKENQNENVSEYDYYDEVEDDEYEVMSHHDYSDKSKHGKESSHTDYSESSFKKEESPIPYLDDFSSRQLIDESDDSEDDYDMFLRDDFYEKSKEDHNHDYDYNYSNYKRYKRNTHSNNAKTHHSHDARSHHANDVRSRHLNDVTPRHSKNLKSRHNHKYHFSPKTYLNLTLTTSETPKRFDLSQDEFRRSKETIRHHRYKTDPKKLRKNKRTVDPPIPEELTLPDEPIASGSSNLRKIVSIPASVRVSFSDMKIKAQYIIRGRAGGVFTFKEQGKLVLTIPNVFLTSQFNVTVIPEIKGLRHWKNSRRNHLRVQKVRSRLSLEVPKLNLIPASRPSEWVRKQLQEKMEELGKGVGKRDGAIRLLLRHWARLLRRLVTKASKQSSSNDFKRITN